MVISYILSVLNKTYYKLPVICNFCYCKGIEKQTVIIILEVLGVRRNQVVSAPACRHKVGPIVVNLDLDTKETIRCAIATALT
jgi:hypothetical protein